MLSSAHKTKGLSNMRVSELLKSLERASDASKQLLIEEADRIRAEEKRQRFDRLVATFMETAAVCREAEQIEKDIYSAIEETFLSIWQSPRNQAAYHLIGFIAFETLEDAERFFAEKDGYLETQYRDTVLSYASPGHADRIVERDRRNLALLRQMACTFLTQKEAAISASGLDAAEEAAVKARECAYAAFYELLDEPCVTIGDVQTKATLFLNAPMSLGGNLEPDETARLLRSFLPASEGGAA